MVKRPGTASAVLFLLLGFTTARLHTKEPTLTYTLTIQGRREAKGENKMHSHTLLSKGSLLFMKCLSLSLSLSLSHTHTHTHTHTPHKVFRLQLQALRHPPDHMVIVAISRIKWHKAPPSPHPTPALSFGTI